MNKKLLMANSLLITIVLAGCTSTSKETPRMTMREAHEMHKQNLYGGQLKEVRNSWGTITTYSDHRNTFNDDLRLPNPELQIYYHPTRTSDGAVSSGFYKKFSMYEKVHYKLGY